MNKNSLILFLSSLCILLASLIIFQSVKLSETRQKVSDRDSLISEILYSKNIYDN